MSGYSDGMPETKSDHHGWIGAGVCTGNGILAFGVLNWTTGFDTTENVFSVTTYWSFDLKIFFKNPKMKGNPNNCSRNQI